MGLVGSLVESVASLPPFTQEEREELKPPTPCSGDEMAEPVKKTKAGYSRKRKLSKRRKSK